jgi:hypothetical protein
MDKRKDNVVSPLLLCVFLGLNAVRERCIRRGTRDTYRLKASLVNRSKRFAEYVICSCPSGLGCSGKKHRAIMGV